jgi:hypothetical protein
MLNSTLKKIKKHPAYNLYVSNPDKADYVLDPKSSNTFSIWNDDGSRQGNFLFTLQEALDFFLFQGLPWSYIN